MSRHFVNSKYLSQSNTHNLQTGKLKDVEEGKSQYTRYEHILERSENFNDQHVSFPTHLNRWKSVCGNDAEKQEEALQHCKETFILVHADCLLLIDKFLEFKRSYGSNCEKDLYQMMENNHLILRLVRDRPLVFYTEHDHNLLRDKKGSAEGWQSIGDDKKEGGRSNLTIKEYLSYDEMQISALLGLSSPTFFINNGNRDNEAKKDENLDKYEPYGIYIGLVGARFEKKECMESQHILITKNCTSANGYGANADPKNPKTKLLRIWAEFYKLPSNYFPSWDELNTKDLDSERYFKKKNKYIFNIEVYKKRMRVTIETLLLEADRRARLAQKKAYVHVVGLGLGVWQVLPKQSRWFVDVFAAVLGEIGLPHIEAVDFSYFSEVNDLKGSTNGATITCPQSTIKIYFSKRNPADKLPEQHKDCLLVASYAWDSNAYPGNEYWVGKLSASGDPAAACSSTIPETQNFLINPFIKWIKLPEDQPDKSKM